MGDLSTGFIAVGPFPSMDTAAGWATGREGWLLHCVDPKQIDAEDAADLCQPEDGECLTSALSVASAAESAAAPF